MNSKGMPPSWTINVVVPTLCEMPTVHVCLPQLAYLNWMATTAHSLGLAVGLKNAGNIVSFCNEHRSLSLSQGKLYPIYSNKVKLILLDGNRLNAKTSNCHVLHANHRHGFSY